MITEKDIETFKYNLRDLALVMNDEDIERVIVTFVEVKIMRDKSKRRWS